MANSLKCTICGATEFHINKIEDGYEVVYMSEQGKDHKMSIKGLSADGMAGKLRYKGTDH